MQPHAGGPHREAYSPGGLAHSLTVVYVDQAQTRALYYSRSFPAVVNGPGPPLGKI